MIPESQFMYPVRSDVELPPAFRLTTPVENLLNLPLETVEANLTSGWPVGKRRLRNVRRKREG